MAFAPLLQIVHHVLEAFRVVDSTTDPGSRRYSPGRLALGWAILVIVAVIALVRTEDILTRLGVWAIVGVVVWGLLLIHLTIATLPARRP